MHEQVHGLAGLCKVQICTVPGTAEFWKATLLAHQGLHLCRPAVAARDACWAPDGSQLCVVFADGMIMVSTSAGEDPERAERRTVPYESAFVVLCNASSVHNHQESYLCMPACYQAMSLSPAVCEAATQSNIACTEREIVRMLGAGAHVWRKQLRLPLACVKWSPDGQRLLVAGASAGCSVLSAAGEPLGQLALPAGQVASVLHAQSCVLQRASQNGPIHGAVGRHGMMLTLHYTAFPPVLDS